MKVRSVAAAAAAALAVSLAGCSTSASTTPAAPATPGASTAAPSDQPTPTPTPEPTALKAGANHANIAAPYAVDGRKVQRWLLQGAKAADYPKTKTVFLTFDDGPSNTVTPRNLDILKKAKVPATFFYVTNDEVLGAADPTIVHRTIAEGHAIAVHSHSHEYSHLYPGRRADVEHISSDVDTAMARIRAVVGADYDTHSYRYPGGHMSWKDLGAADAMLAKRGLAWLDWNALTGDAEPPSRAPHSPDGAFRFLKQSVSPQDNVVVVLMHDTYGKTLSTRALPRIIDYFRKGGYTFGVLA